MSDRSPQDNTTRSKRRRYRLTDLSHGRGVKAYSLKLLAQMATEQGYEVSSYAPSAEAANVLTETEEANIESNTIARLLNGKANRYDQAV